MPFSDLTIIILLLAFFGLASIFANSRSVAVKLTLIIFIIVGTVSMGTIGAYCLCVCAVACLIYLVARQILGYPDKPFEG